MKLTRATFPWSQGKLEDIGVARHGYGSTEYQPQVHCESYLGGRGEDDHRRIMRLGGDANYSGARDEMQIDLDSARRDSVKHDVQADEQVESMLPDEVETPDISLPGTGLHGIAASNRS